MIAAVCASAAVGLWLTIALLYYVPAYILASSSTSTDNPQGIGSFGTLFVMLQAATGSHEGTNALAILIALALFTSGPALMTVTSRHVFAMARDGALPFSRTLRYLHPRTEAPVSALLAVVCAVAVMVLIQIGSLAAFQSIVNPYVAYTQVRDFLSVDDVASWLCCSLYCNRSFPFLLCVSRSPTQCPLSFALLWLEGPSGTGPSTSDASPSHLLGSRWCGCSLRQLCFYGQLKPL